MVPPPLPAKAGDGRPTAQQPPALPAKTGPGRTSGTLPPTPATPGAPSPASSTASSTADHTDPAAVRQRRRHNLMSFYGIKEQAPGEGAGAPVGTDGPELTLSNPLDIGACRSALGWAATP